MSWQGWVDSLKQNGCVEEAAICGIAPGAEGIWACSEGLKNITAEEIKKIVCDRGDLPINGCTFAGKKCRLLIDRMDMDQVHSCELKTKATSESDTPVNVCVGKTNQAIIVAFGKKDCPGGQISQNVYSCCSKLRESGY